MTAPINSSPLRSILAAYVHVLAAQGRRLGAALAGGAAGYTGPEPPAAVTNVVDSLTAALDANPGAVADRKSLIGSILKVGHAHGLPDYSGWLESKYAPDPVAISAEAAGPVFVTPANASEGYDAGRAVLVVHGARALRTDLTIGPPIPASAGLRLATQDEIVATLEAWATRAGISPTLEWTGDRLIGAWADYSARATSEAFGGGPAAAPDLAAAIAKLGLPPAAVKLAEALLSALSPEQKAAAAATLGASAAPAAPTSGPLPAVPALTVLVPTATAGGFRSGSPILVIGSNVDGGYLVWNGSSVVLSPAGARREHVRPAGRDEAHRFLADFVGRVASAARAAA